MTSSSQFWVAPNPSEDDELEGFSWGVWTSYPGHPNTLIQRTRTKEEAEGWITEFLAAQQEEAPRG